ncbi:Coenzyme F420 hydrogenase/dehydrogenase, beta subunit C-terminal domain [Parabacteroides gordonii]|uniref:Coenzyme F420 hydrogenase/dehydrogenase, beta subunit C-terminal domain n=1 Tax=Parabacteroides gordonii TaxID=574930 RepID=UPI0026F151BD|nr:Coenzyme F420 hydrogenase/dehydrogenase, beta subunit C-terminal domain [Parabacteroides gordonii]
MIHLINKQDCCGCNSCVQCCPKSCITMREDEEGFLYPYVDESTCVNCGLCEKVCPVISQEKERKPISVYAAKNKNDEIRKQSSSGGVFTVLAEEIIKEGGVVFGARFDEKWKVVHDYTETIEGLSVFRGSKYVQSRMEDNFKKIQYFLKKGRKVLFSGTPCQIAGLKCFLHKEYDNLLTVDFICHGVPSPGVWREYLSEEIARQCDGKNTVLSHPNDKNRDVNIESISFRDKRLGWKKFSFALTLSVSDRHGEKNSVLLSEPLNKNIFMRGFLADLYLRPSCYACPAKCFKSGSDITIGDFWGIERVMPEIDDDKGMSVVMMNTEKGIACFQKIDVDCYLTKYEHVLRYNSAIERSVSSIIKREYFYSEKGSTLTKRVEKLTRLEYKQQFRVTLSRLFGKRVKHFIKIHILSNFKS